MTNTYIPKPLDLGKVSMIGDITLTRLRKQSDRIRDYKGHKVAYKLVEKNGRFWHAIRVFWGEGENLTGEFAGMNLVATDTFAMDQAFAWAKRIIDEEYNIMTEEMINRAREYRAPQTSTPELLECGGFKTIQYGLKTICIGYFYNGPASGYYAAVYIFTGDQHTCEGECRLIAISDNSFEDEGHAMRWAFSYDEEGKE